MSLSKYKPTRLNGHVEFIIPDVLGTTGVSGMYRRIAPTNQRPVVPLSQIESLAAKLTSWAEQCGFKNDHFERFPIHTLSLTATQFAVVWLPDAPFESKKMEFFSRFLLWTWVLDDAMEESWRDGRMQTKNIATLQYIHETFFNIIRKVEIDEPLPYFPEYPDFATLCNCTKGMVASAEEVAGKENYVQAIEPFASTLEFFTKSCEWFTVSRVDKRYSLRTFHRWRVLNTGADSVLEASAFADGIQIPQNIRRNPAFMRMVNIMVTNVQLVNDVLGVKKDFNYKDGDPDNEIVFRVLRKGDPIDVAIAETCRIMDEELSDLILIKQAVVDQFGEEDEMLLRYLDKVDTFIDGQNQVYVENVRYECDRGFVRLTREE